MFKDYVKLKGFPLVIRVPPFPVVKKGLYGLNRLSIRHTILLYQSISMTKPHLMITYRDEQA